MIEIDNKLVSEELFSERFVCDLSACKGECCVAGDAGAPLETKEIDIIRQNLNQIKPFMTEEGKNEISSNDIYYYDKDGTPVTTLVNDAACAFVYFEGDVAKCSIEKAYQEGSIDFIKPISCHLYPVRVKKLKFYDALNYDRWDICKPACECGSELNVPIYRFLKGPLIRAYGEDFFKKLEIVDKEYIGKT